MHASKSNTVDFRYQPALAKLARKTPLQSARKKKHFVRYGPPFEHDGPEENEAHTGQNQEAHDMRLEVTRAREAVMHRPNGFLA